MYAWTSLWQGTSVPRLVWGPVSFALFAVTLVGAVLLYRYGRGRAESPVGLDERERILRDRALAFAYRALSLCVILAVAVVAVGVLGAGAQVVLNASAVGALVVAVAVLVPLLPTAALAWLEPDAPPEA